MEKCFCHFNGYKVKDADARRMIEEERTAREKVVADAKQAAERATIAAAEAAQYAGNMGDVFDLEFSPGGLNFANGAEDNSEDTASQSIRSGFIPILNGFIGVIAPDGVQIGLFFFNSNMEYVRNEEYSGASPYVLTHLEEKYVRVMAYYSSGTVSPDADTIVVYAQRTVPYAVRYDIQSLTTEQQAQARKNIGAEMPSTLLNLLKELVSAAVYTSDQSGNVEMIKTMLDNKSTVRHNVTNSFVFVTSDNPDNSVINGNPYIATLSAVDDYLIETVNVTMSGVDITDTVYNGNGKITISAVTGDVVITATARYAYFKYNDIVKGNFSFVEGESLTLTTVGVANKAIVIPVCMYLTKGRTYQFSLGDIASNYHYSAVKFDVGVDGLTFDLVDGQSITYEVSGITKVGSTGWTQADTEYAVTSEHIILVVNFKKSDDGNMTEDDYELLKTNFKIMEV